MKVVTTQNILHDGVAYDAARELDLDDDQAKRLVELGVAEEVKAKAEPKKK